MKAQIILVFLTLAIATADNSKRRFTPLTIDNHPCNAKNLKHAVSYICDSDGNVNCINGWERDPLESPLNPCSKPVCNPLCGPNGECKAPNYCTCDVGWEGRNCSQCIDLPGCDHGSCANGGKAEALTCKCDANYTGGLCDIPTCNPPCRSGVCVSPNTCDCFDGWDGQGCDTCVKLPGCVSGSCTNSKSMESVGHGCFCEPGYQGALCDQLDCSPNECANGDCKQLGDDTIQCICNLGWRGPNCTECVAQPNGCSSGQCINNTPWTCSQ